MSAAFEAQQKQQLLQSLPSSGEKNVDYFLRHFRSQKQDKEPDIGERVEICPLSLQVVFDVCKCIRSAKGAGNGFNDDLKFHVFIL